MDIIRFNDFINENMHDSPEEYIKIRLNKLKIKIEKLFEKPAEKEEGVIKMSDALKKGKEKEHVPFTRSNSNIINLILFFILSALFLFFINPLAGQIGKEITETAENFFYEMFR